VAIKIINKNNIKSKNNSKKIKRELRLLRFFSHPNIIKLYEVLDTTTDILVVMEYIEGGELFELISSRGRIPEDEARFYFKQIFAGVSYCH
jgi:5'-AMP-activated protein kinase, catalytic alpha subunit